MTTLGLRYLEHKEAQRSNIARETETNRHNVVTERQTDDQLAETARHNVATEGIQRDTLSENIRHNMATEFETNRANVARETETHRANVAQETELHRSNVARETETNRSNLAKEFEANRANVAKETENTRAALQKELQNTKKDILSAVKDLGLNKVTSNAYINKVNSATSQEDLYKIVSEFAPSNLAAIYDYLVERGDVRSKQATEMLKALGSVIPG